jgi:hypothetical protein
MNIGQLRRHTREKLVRKCREVDKLLADGADIATVARHLGVSEQGYHRWTSSTAACKPDDADANGLKELERENALFKGIVADQVLDIVMLKEVATGNF